MTKIIDLNNRNKYQEELDGALKYLDQIKRELTTRAIHLAIADKWKEWDNKQKTGAVVQFSNNALQDIGDKNIDALIELTENIDTVQEVLQISN